MNINEHNEVNETSSVNVKAKKKGKPKGQLLVAFIFILIGAVCGLLFTRIIDSFSSSLFSGMKGGGALLFALLIVVMYITMLLHIILHEAGHLLFGLMTGYRFSSFRIGSLMLVKEDGRLKSKKLKLAGTGGQCLMTPPDMKDGRIPFVIFNLGGAIVNLLTAAIALVVNYFFSSITLLSSFLLMFALIGIAFAMTNGIPLRLGMVDNDGRNAVALGKNPEALRSFWVQMKVNSETSRGVMLKDMPEEWFSIPSDEGMRNSMTAVMGVFYCNLLMERRQFEDAERLMTRYIEGETAIVGLHKGLLVCDLICCKLLLGRETGQLDRLFNTAQKKFMKSMKSYPAVVRTEYFLNKRYKKDEKKANDAAKLFDKIAKSYPYPVEIENERQLMALCDADDGGSR